ncbi:unnamed protein product [Caenorhabditis angaria]|uniref:Uncharacterized protein n=1 Tax=Caenorhabditis angaria TaxID=860376 RepID=A0A9P1J4A5_9PELO|nr:unnamed protein product [Caenorhabditis angaria]
MSTDPLVFWFNGGPGCSSLTGFLYLNGPVLLKDGKFMEENPYSWTKFSNVVWLESPVSVGFSYSKINTHPDDNISAARDNYLAVMRFLEIFPKFKNHDIFLAGGSYAGIFIPMLSSRILEGSNDIKLKNLAEATEYFRNIQKASEALQFPLEDSGDNILYMTHLLLGKCEFRITYFHNPDNLSYWSRNCVGLAIGSFSLSLNIKTSFIFSYTHGIIDEETYRKIIKNCCYEKTIEECDILDDWANTACHQMYNIIAEIKALDIYDINRECENLNCNKTFELTNNYMNREDVREILKIPKGVKKWTTCQTDFKFSRGFLEMDQDFRKASRENVKSLLFYGDADMVCPFTMGQLMLDRLGLKLLQDSSVYAINETIIGQKTVYENIEFLVFKNAGHILPSTHPEAFFEIHRRFFNFENV